MTAARKSQPRIHRCISAGIGVTGLAVIAAFLTLAKLAVAEPVCPFNEMNPEQCAGMCAARFLRPAHPVPFRPSETTVAVQMKNMARTKVMHMDMSLPAASRLLMQEGSGTSLNPASAPMPMRMFSRGGWRFNFMGNAFVTDTQQSGPRGGDKLYSTNAFMTSAEHSIGRGALLIEGMFSLEPATITDRRYPQLFQTGETAYGVPLEDGQHPHNFFMGLGVHYARPVGRNTIFEAYFAPVGDPALGPIAFPHRASADEIPQAPIGHHWEDSAHISYEVVTVGIKHKFMRLEASGFHGAEPGENRWIIATGAVDSWSTRLSIIPTPNWAAQVSVGRLTHPEALEAGDVVRTTASVEYSRSIGTANWSTSFVFGRNHKTATGDDTNAFLLESVVPFRKSNFLTGRWELVDKDELFAAQPAIEQQLAIAAGFDTFRVGAYTVGYTRYFSLFSPIETGLGANFSAYTFPSAIVSFYGAHPFGVNFYLHLQLKPSKQTRMGE
jgi:hypothetical protein